jgi:hypothetical protein
MGILSQCFYADHTWLKVAWNTQEKTVREIEQHTSYYFAQNRKTRKYCNAGCYGSPSLSLSNTHVYTSGASRIFFSCVLRCIKWANAHRIQRRIRWERYRKNEYLLVKLYQCDIAVTQWDTKNNFSFTTPMTSTKRKLLKKAIISFKLLTFEYFNIGVYLKKLYKSPGTQHRTWGWR